MPGNRRHSSVTGYFFLALLWSGSIFGQTCDLSISGFIRDAGTDEPLPFSSVLLEKDGVGEVADENGFFQLRGVCPGDYHLLVRHVGCEPERIFFSITQDTSLVIHLQHHTELIDEVIIHGSREENTTQVSNSISSEGIASGGDGNLGSLLDGLTGVSTLKNGSGIAKPVIHGLFGNRITILNNGIPQSGQQWGNDHAPEIDPFAADHLSVVKGVAALAHSGNGLGGLVMVEPGRLSDEPHLHGHLNYLFASNGRGHTLSTQLEQGGRRLKWRMTATLRRQGDTRSPDYFLTNTGRREANVAIDLQRQLFGEWDTRLYYSYFSTQLGVLRGSHIGNLTDLEQAIGREQPFFTQDRFSYDINAPRQEVDHHLVKLQSSKVFSGQQRLRWTYALQLNNRKEFDVRRGDRSDRPALSLRQWSHRFGADYSRPWGEFGLFKSGLQFDFTDNDNVPGTGVLPLIPNYRSFIPALYAILLRERNKWTTEWGVRYEYVALNAKTISREPNPSIIEYSPRFQQFSAAFGGKYRWNAHRRLSFNLGLARRAPAVNELYSNGLHQGVSGIEEGQVDLSPENSVKATLSYDWAADNDRLFLQATAYYQGILNYIYLQPQPDFRLTIRGSFPVFRYEQTNATIAGLDLLFSLEPTESFKIVNTASFLRGQDLSNDLPLVFMPANRMGSRWEYAFPDGNFLSNTEVSLSGEYTFRQNRLEEGQDLLLPPDAYFLVNAKASTHLPLGNSFVHLTLRLDNVFNVRYRDYLNRLRYYADELGRNLVVGLNWEF